MSVQLFVRKLREVYGDYYSETEVPLHRPVFEGNEKNYLLKCIDSNFVSSASEYVTRFEAAICEYTHAKHSVLVVNGTAALNASLIVAGVLPGDLVLTQAFTFVATGNAIRQCGARPIFIDIDEDCLGLSPTSLTKFLDEFTQMREGNCFHKSSNKRISACVPMHTFGNPCRVKQLQSICKRRGIVMIEDAAESLGSRVGDKHTGLIGLAGTLSFNGNKIITAGGGGAVLTDDKDFATRLKHITTTAKVPHRFEYQHNEMGYNYRMPGINAALGLAQLENLQRFLTQKQILGSEIKKICNECCFDFVEALAGTHSNNWLITVRTSSLEERNALLEGLHSFRLYARPAWLPLNQLPHFKGCLTDALRITQEQYKTVVCLPSSAPAAASA